MKYELIDLNLSSSSFELTWLYLNIVANWTKAMGPDYKLYHLKGVTMLVATLC